MLQKNVERKSLIVSGIINLVMAAAGFWVFSQTGLQALFLDAFFSLGGFLSTVIAIIISRTSKKTTKSYPDGLYFLEPFYAVVRSLVILILLIVSVSSTVTTAYNYFVYGTGTPIKTGPIIYYEICMVVLCFGLYLFNRLQNKKIDNMSTIIAAETQANLVDGILSFGIGVAIVILKFTDIDGPLGFLHYTGDFFITTFLALLTVNEPLKILISSFKELSNGTTCEPEIINTINTTVNTHLDGIVERKRCDVFKVGMHIKVRILLLGASLDNAKSLMDAKEKIADELKKKYESLELVFVI